MRTKGRETDRRKKRLFFGQKEREIRTKVQKIGIGRGICFW